MEQACRVKLAVAGRRVGEKEVEELAVEAKSHAGGVEMPWNSVGKTCRPLFLKLWIMLFIYIHKDHVTFSGWRSGRPLSLYSAHKKCICYCRVAAVAEKISLTFWEMLGRD